MKNIIITTFCLLIISCSTKVSSQIQEINNEQLNYVLGTLRTNSIKSLLINNTHITTYFYVNESGSANTPETDEVTDNIIFTVCESGENFNCKSYLLKNLLNPQIDSIFSDKEHLTVLLTHIKMNDNSYESIKTSIKLPLPEIK